MSGLRALLAELESTQATGRVRIRGVRPAVVLLEGGRIYLAERSDLPNLLIAMGSAELFTAEEWTLALRLPTREKWRALVADDEERLAELTDFARRYTAEVLTSLLMTDIGSVSFSEQVAHPFGPLDTWTVTELVGDLVDAGADAEEPDDVVEARFEALPPERHADVHLDGDLDPILEPDSYDRREFLEMLLEVSPLVRTQL